VKSSKKEIERNVSSLHVALDEAVNRTGRIVSMALRDAVLRERLGLVWMRRGRNAA
jgi:hypothetical protein